MNHSLQIYIQGLACIQLNLVEILSMITGYPDWSFPQSVQGI